MTNIEEILFRASGVSALMTDAQGTKITENQLKSIDELLNEKLNGVNINGNKVKWTDKKESELASLITKRDAPPQLSKTAKTFVQKTWLQKEKGIRPEIKSKYLDKGIFCEDDGIGLLSDLEGVFYSKNEERKNDDCFTGECDIYHVIDGVKTIYDIKSSWNAETFMNATLSDDYYWQLQVYLHLWDADIAYLKYCLLDAPPHLLQKEKDSVKWKYFSSDMSDVELDEMEKALEPLYLQIETNLTYSNNPSIQKIERVKSFVIERNSAGIRELQERVKMAREYYKTITLNGQN